MSVDPCAPLEAQAPTSCVEDGSHNGKAHTSHFSAPTPFKISLSDPQPARNIFNTMLSDAEFAALGLNLNRDCIDNYKSYLTDECNYTHRVVPDYPQRMQMIDSDSLSLIFDNLIRCANALKMCETAVYLTVDIVHRIMSKVYIGATSPFLLATTLFMVQKVEPGRDGIFLASRFLNKLFGKNNEHFSFYDLRDNEITLLEFLDFHIETITPYQYVAYFSDVAGFSLKQRYLLHYLTQMCVMTPESYRYRPSALTAAGVLLVHEVSGMPQWMEKLHFCTTYVPADLHGERAFVLSTWKQITERAQRDHPPAVFVKFSSPDFMSVSVIAPPEL